MNIEINDGESWSFDHEPYGALVRFRWRCWLHDTTTDMPHSVAPQEGRWWYIDQNADEAHIVRSAWLAYKTFMMHEMLERFRYRGDLVFNPHFNI
jgi:hypothetical protein